MSLIQEALRRQQEEAGEVAPELAPPPVQDIAKGTGAEGAKAEGPKLRRKIETKPKPAGPEKAEPVPSSAPPPVPPMADEPPVQSPMPEEEDSEALGDESTETQAGGGPAGEKAAKKKPKAVQVVLLGILLMGGAAAGLIYGLPLLKGGAPAAAPVAPPPVAPPPTPTPVGAGVVDESHPAFVEETIPGDAPPGTPPNTTPTPQPGTGTQTAQGGTGTGPAKPPVPQVVQPPKPPPKPVVEWPSLTLTGVVGKGKNGSAILSGQIIGVGEQLEGVEVISIGNRKVDLRYQGETKTIPIGASTN